MKYIMFECLVAGGTKQMVPVIFPNQLVHEQMAVGSLHVLRRHYASAKPVSAGTLTFMQIGIKVSGRSETLDLESRPEDAHIIEAYDYTHGLQSDRFTWDEGDIEVKP